MLMRPRGGGSSGGGGGKTGPANIGLLTSSVTHNAATSCRDALVAEGHTVTLIADSDVGTHDFASYDLVITSRTANASRAAIAARLNELNNAGMPLIVGSLEAGASNQPVVETHTTLMGITGTCAVEDYATYISVVKNDHPVTDGVALGTHTLSTTASNYMVSVGSGQSYVGVLLANGATSTIAGLPVIFAMEVGEGRLTSGVLGARIVFFPTYLISGAYTELHRKLLNQAVEWAI